MADRSDAQRMQDHGALRKRRQPQFAAPLGISANGDKLKELGENPLRRMRRQSYLTQEQVAQRLGVSQKRVSEIEHADINSLQVGTLNRYLNAIDRTLHIIVASD